KGLEKWSADKSKELRKATDIALRREGFLLAQELKKEIRKRISPGLSSIARRKLGTGRFTSRKPFTGLAGTKGSGGGVIPIRYNPTREGSRLGVEIGMVDTKQEKISKSWKRIFIKQQEGFSQNISERQRQYLIGIGANISKRSKFRKYFFLLKKTKTLKTPARPVVDPFWQKWQSRSMQRLSDNFNKKMAGERI
ncbi:MAG: hypothetical protein PF495_17630, partial [Spirochaetales bacterium]|nr:hypothetical protein [Spirochaetales bacterium]